MALIRSKLTRNIDDLYAGIRDEMITSFGDVLNLSGCGEEPDLTSSYHTLIQLTLRMEERTPIKCLRKDHLQNVQPSVCRAAAMYAPCRSPYFFLP